MSRLRRALPAVLLVAGSAALGLLTVSPVINPPKWDEFIIVYDAHRVVQGQFPYRDFFNFIPPGVFLYLAAWFKVLGASTLTIGRYAGLVVMILTLLAAFAALRRRLGNPLWAALVAGLLPVLYPFWAIPSHQWLASAFFIGLAAWLGRGTGPGKTVSGWAVAGALAGCALISLQPLGLAALLICGIHILQVKSWRAFLGCAGGAALVWVPWLGAAALAGATGDFVRDTVLWPSANYSRPGNENWGPVLGDLPGRLGDLGRLLAEGNLSGGWFTALAGWGLYGGLLLLGLGTLVMASLCLVRTLKRRNLAGPWTACALLITFLLTGLLLRGNPNWLHLVLALFPIVVLWGMAVPEERASWPPGARILLRGLLVFLLASGVVYHARGLWRHVPEGWELSDTDRPIREQPVNRYLRTPGVLAPGDTLAAFPEGGEVYLYGAPAAVGYTYFLPLGHHYSSLEDHAAVAAQILSRRPRFILVTPDLEREYLDSRSAVGQVMRQKYRRVGVMGLAVLYEPVPGA